MNSEDFILNNTLGQLNIKKSNINELGIILDDIDKKTKNIKRGGAQLNNLLVYNGTDWVPASISGGSDGVVEAEVAASESLESRNTAEQYAANAATSATNATTSATNASTSATNADTLAATADGYKIQTSNQLSSVTNSNGDVSTSLGLISSRADSNNPIFTGTVQLPSGTTINNVPILLANQKIITSACISASAFNSQYSTLNDTEVPVEFDEVHKNNTGTPSMGSTSSPAASTLWNVSGSITSFTVPANKGGIYEISTQVTIDAGYNGVGDDNANGTDHVIRVYKRTSGNLNTLIMENKFNLCERPDVNSTRETSYDIVSRKAKDIVYLEAGEEIWVAVKVIVIDGTVVNWRIREGPVWTFLNIREVAY